MDMMNQMDLTNPIAFLDKDGLSYFLEKIKKALLQNHILIQRKISPI